MLIGQGGVKQQRGSINGMAMTWFDASDIARCPGTSRCRVTQAEIVCFGRPSRVARRRKLRQKRNRRRLAMGHLLAEAPYASYFTPRRKSPAALFTRLPWAGGALRSTRDDGARARLGLFRHTKEDTVARSSAGITRSSATVRKPATRVPPAAKAPRAGRGSSGAGGNAFPAPKLNKEELRAQVEKLERANAKLRLKAREAGRSGKDAAARIAELEGEVARLERQLKRQTPRETQDSAPAPARRSRRREIDPGDAVPPGVAVKEPEPLDREAETALAAIEENLPGDEGEE